MKAALRAADDGTFISLRVSPGARKCGIGGMYDGSSIKLKVAAPPVDGKANKEVEDFLAKLLGLSKSDVEVVRGLSSRDKTVLARGMEFSEIERILGKFA